jgi:AAA+ superfamily predicted ATPase
MKLDKKFEEKMKSMLEKYAKRPEKSTASDDDNDEDYEEYDGSLGDSENFKDKYYFYYKITEQDAEEFDDEINYMNNISTDSGTVFIKLFDNEDKKVKKQPKQKSKKMAVIYFYDEDLISSLQEIIDTASTMYETEPNITLIGLLYCINNLREKFDYKTYSEIEDKNNLLVNVLGFVEDLFADNIKKMDNMIKDEVIDFESLWYLFDKPNQIYTVKKHDEKINMRQEAFSYGQDAKENECFFMHGTIIAIKEKGLYEAEIQHIIKKFKGLKSIKSFNINKLEKDDYQQFIEIGNKVIDYHDKIKHVKLKGKQYFMKRFDICSTLRNERVVIDHEGGEQMGYDIPYEFNFNDTVDVSTLTDEEKVIIYPFITTYNLGTNKLWGVANVKYMTEITHNKDAFNHLVLDKKKKETMIGAINKYKDGKEDFIDNKGKGLIFLLYGPPGVGKTLSAEATCELLERPLYSVNVGDLGTHPESMESELDKIKDYVNRWNAIILIDEVDIFVEDREYSDITRNAMVCIFLKFLEYHENIIFLTTNRLKSIDPAVKSRINLFLAYQDLTEEMRKQIWKSLLTIWNIKFDDNLLEDLSEYKINGREIRNYLKLVLAIHEDKKIAITNKSIIKVLEDCFSFTGEFTTKMDKPLYS